jgi:hypothetical protein
MKTVAYAIFIAAPLATGLGLSPGQVSAQESVAESIVVKGDLRLRYEPINEEGEAERKRGRFRARLGMTAEVNENVTAILQIASGGDNPTSTNQSFEDGFSRKDIGLDLAYLDWTPNDKIHVYGGKMKNPFHRAGSHALVWDNDLNPEGLAISYRTGGFFGTAGLMFVEERAATNDTILTAFQAGYSLAISERMELTSGVGYFSYSDTIGNAPFYDGKARGNSVDIDGNLIMEYKQLELFVEVDTKIGNRPANFFANIVENSEAPTSDGGYSFGATVGKAGDPGTWQASYVYQDLEADAVIATYTDSDFGGGGTDNKGHVVRGKYALDDGWALAGSFFLNEVDEFAGNPHDYNRLQLDLEFKF